LPPPNELAIAIGALNGIIDRVIDSVDAGSLSIANMLMNGRDQEHHHGCLRLTRFLLVGRHGAHGKRHGPNTARTRRGSQPKTTAVLVVTCGIWEESAVVHRRPRQVSALREDHLVDTPQIKN